MKKKTNYDYTKSLFLYEFDVKLQSEIKCLPIKVKIIKEEISQRHQQEVPVLKTPLYYSCQGQLQELETYSSIIKSIILFSLLLFETSFDIQNFGIDVFHGTIFHGITRETNR